MHRAVTSNFFAGLFALMLAVAGSQCASAAGVNNPPKYFPLTNVYTSSQTVTCPPTATWADVEAVGAAGGGGGSSATLGGGGGGAGALTEGLFLCSAGSIYLSIGTAAPAVATSGACSQGPPGGDTIATQGSLSITGGAGANGIAAGCGPGAGGTASSSGPVGVYLKSNGNAGAAGSGTIGGLGGSGPNPGARGGFATFNSLPSNAGFAIVTFF